jgi:NAD(P)-dependent dehydrogenase (short-subunit alcohol dehydrogenase family)
MELLEGRVAIVTGGSGALGRAVVENFLIAGAKVAAPYIVDAEIPLLEQRLGNRFPSAQMLVRKYDVGVEEQISKLVEEVVHT